jgi:hypothetical protein
MQPTGDGVLQVEPTDHCNLSCRMCAPHYEGWETVHGVPKGFLDPELWARVVAGLARDDVRFDHIIFQWLGDPSLHPQLGRLIGDAARGLAGRVGYLRVDTNLIRLTPPRIDDLLAQLGEVEGGPPLLVVVTIDAHTAPTYADVKGQDALERVRRHVRHLVRARRTCRATVNLQLQFVVQDGNADEARPFLDYWADLLVCQGDGDRFHDEVCFKRLSVGGGAAGQAAADALYERTIAEAGIRPGRHGAVTVVTWAQRPWQQDDGHAGGRTACPGLWLTPVIRQDGHLLMCCADLHSTLDLGSLEAATFRVLWDGPVATAKRMAHLAGRFEGVCAGCGGINWYETTPGMAARARARAAALGLETA